MKILESSRLDKETLSLHRLEGYFYKYHPHLLTGEQKETAANLWKAQWLKNEQYRQELNSLAVDISKTGIEVAILKGMALLDKIYADIGSRPMSDMDLLVSARDLPTLSNIIKRAGYSELSLKKWKGDDFKACYSKMIRGQEIVIEVHTRLFYHADLDLSSEMVASAFLPLKELSLEMMFVHLAGHAAFQHTFLHLGWLLDLERFYKRYATELDWQRVLVLATELKLIKSCRYVFHILKIFFDLDLSSQIPGPLIKKLSFFERKLLSAPFLLAPKANLLVYLWIKFLVKDNWSLALGYNLAWLRWFMSRGQEQSNLADHNHHG